MCERMRGKGFPSAREAIVLQCTKDGHCNCLKVTVQLPAAGSTDLQASNRPVFSLLPVITTSPGYWAAEQAEFTLPSPCDSYNIQGGLCQAVDIIA